MNENGGKSTPASVEQPSEYEPPMLTILGTVEDITKAVGNTGALDGDGTLKSGDSG